LPTQPENIMRPSLAALTLLVIGSCGQTAPSAPIEAAGPGTAAESATAELRIVRTGDVHYVVGDLAAARATVQQQAEANGGYVASDVSDEVAHAPRLTMRVRIPSARFDAFVVAIRQLGELEHHRLDAVDSTAQCVDLEARLGAKRASEQRYLELVGKANNIREVLEVENVLGGVRADIESMASQLRTLNDQVAMSTLTITCTLAKVGTGVAGEQFGAALADGWNATLLCVVGLLRVWPLLLLAATTIVIAWRTARRRQPVAPALP
jgi:hypothetical protein